MKLRIPENLTQQAYRSIRDEIIKGKLDGHQRLTEGCFATRFGISKSPIREALNRLESEGLVTIRPRRGAFLSEFSIHDVDEIFELREVLEPLAVRQTVINSKILATMRESVRAAKVCLRANNMPNYIIEDAAFHSILVQSCKNQRLKTILENMRNQMLILRRKTFELTGHSSVKQHAEILSALERGRRDLAAKLMAQHIRTVRSSLMDHLKAARKKSARLKVSQKGKPANFRHASTPVASLR